MEAVIIYRSSWEARKSIPFFSAVDCNNSSPSQSTKTLRSDFLFSFSLIDPSRRCCPSPPSIDLFLVRLSVFTDIFPHHFTSFVIYFWSFHIIRDIFLPIFTSYFFLLHCLHCLSTILPQIIIPFSLIYFRSDYINCVRETIQVI